MSFPVIDLHCDMTCYLLEKKDADVFNENHIGCAIPHLIKGNQIKPKAIVVDVGINKTEEGKIIGDVMFDDAKDVASYITPVPGGVGPMTITALLENTLKAQKLQMEK